MGVQNSTIEQQIRPNSLQEELGIKKDAYYAYLKHLDIKAEKDSEGKAFLTEAQANQIRALRKHVVEGGKIEDFQPEMVALAVANSGEIDNAKSEEPVQEIDPSEGLNMESLYLEASEIAAQRLTAGERVVMAMASQMGYEDLHPQARAKVDQVRASVSPKFNAQKVAADLLSKCKQQMAQAAA